MKLKIKLASLIRVILIIAAILILVIDALVNKERLYIVLVFAMIGIVKILELIYNFKMNKN